MRPKRTRVLRATDVIPPFGTIPPRPGADGGDPAPPEPLVSEGGDRDHPAENDLGEDAGRSNLADRDTAGPSSAGGGEIPEYNLAENILAEQRRVASRRRRAPTQPEEEPPAPAESSDFAPLAPETPSDDLPELQRIVAEIVAKDIERLCRRPDR